MHLLAYSEDHAPNVLEQITPVDDAQITIQNNAFLFNNDVLAFWACAMNADIVRARMRTPTIEVFPSAYIRPLEGNLVPGTIPGVQDMRANPLRFAATELIVADAESDQAMGNQRTTVLVGIGDGLSPAPSGEFRAIRGTSTTAAVANAWSLVQITWDEDLPQGTYQVVGLEHFSTNAQAARLVLQGQMWYPGSVSQVDQENRTSPIFLRGGLGSWGQFNSNVMPNIQVLCNAADAVHTVYMHYVRTG